MSIKKLSIITGLLVIILISWVIFITLPRKKVMKIREEQMAIHKADSVKKSYDSLMICIPAIVPIKNKDLIRTASGYGMRLHPIYKTMMFHYGMDFTAPQGSEICATGNGIIVETNFDPVGLGYHIVIDHGFGYITTYGHLNKFNVKIGQKVKRGDVIGFVGHSGTATASHLHYEVKLDGLNVNPMNYYVNEFDADEYQLLLNILGKSDQSIETF